MDSGPHPRASYADIETLPRHLVGELLPDVPWFTTPPDWVCEVLSPSTAAVDRAIKMPLHANAGVGHLWLLDPVLRTLEVFAREGTRWLLLDTHADDARVRAEPFTALEWNLDVLWLRKR